MDSLDRLLKEAKAFAWKQTALAPDKRQHPTFTPYANPENWLKGELIELIHEDASGTRSLGTFRELLYRHGGRKLVPEAALSGCRSERVSGVYWLEPRPETPPARDFPEAERLELRNRLVNLIAEWESEDE